MLTSLTSRCVVKSDDVYDVNKSRELSRAVVDSRSIRCRASFSRASLEQRRQLLSAALSRSPFYSRRLFCPVRSSSDSIEADSKRRQLRATALDIIASRGALDFLRAHRPFFFVTFPFATIDTGRRSFSFIKVSIQSREDRIPRSSPPVGSDVRRGRRP